MNRVELAVIADIHGNALALDAVLADIKGRGVATIVNLGDNANGPLEPARCVESLRACGAIHVRGNGDRMTGEEGSTARGSALFARQRLDAEALRWLRELPTKASGDDWLAFHAAPGSDEEYLLEKIVNGKVVLASHDEIASRLGTVSESLVLCGHTHLPRCVQISNGPLIVNPGSVGLPAYRDTSHPPHVVETESPDARYAMVRRDAERWSVELIAVTYDVPRAAAMARAAGWNEWAHNLETGRCP